MTPQLIMYIGSMFSGKTSRLLSHVERFKYQNKKIVAFKPYIDTRYATSAITSHLGWKIDAVPVKTGTDIISHVNKNIPECDVVVCDELFMIPHGAISLLTLFNSGKTIVVASLDLSAHYLPFEEVKQLLPYATHIEKCAAVCTTCFKDASYTYAKIDSDKEVVVGGSERYEPRCWEHYPLINSKEEKS